MKKKNKIKIDIISDNSLIIPEYIIDIKNKSKKTIELIEYYEKLKNLEIQNKGSKLSENKEKKKIYKKTFKKRKYFKKTKKFLLMEMTVYPLKFYLFFQI